MLRTRSPDPEGAARSVEVSMIYSIVNIGKNHTTPYNTYIAGNRKKFSLKTSGDEIKIV